MSASPEERSTPTDAGDGWPLGRAEDAGMDAALLAGLAPQFEAWEEANCHAALVVRHGRLVYERYFAGEDRGWAKPLGTIVHHAGLMHDLYSVTKSIASLLVGIAIDQGLIGGLDQPVLPCFPEHSDLRTSEKDSITLRHLLTMSAGFAWDETLPYSNPANSWRRMIAAPDPHR
jgi:CubicO group peptidase (beta-lactamase class C family)